MCTTHPVLNRITFGQYYYIIMRFNQLSLITFDIEVKHPYKYVYADFEPPNNNIKCATLDLFTENMSPDIPQADRSAMKYGHPDIWQ